MSTHSILRNLGCSLADSEPSVARNWLTSAVQALVTRVRQFRYPALVLCAEGALAGLAYALSVRWFFQGQEPGNAWIVLGAVWPWLISLRLLGFVAFQSHRISLGAASSPELLCIVKAVSFGSLAFWTTTSIATGFHLPAAWLLLDWTLCLFLVGGLHFGFPLYKAQRAMGRRRGTRALIVGAGDAGTSILKELVLDVNSRVLPVGLVDDDPQKSGVTICGVPVLGGVRELPQFVRERRAEEILICVPSATRAEMREMLGQCRECGVPVRALPSIAELADGRVAPRDFRSVQIEDLLQREEVTSDPEVVRKTVGGRIVLVTGAGGSIGSELCRQIAAGHPRKLVLLEKSENSLFYIHLALQERFPDVAVEPRLADVTSRERVAEILEHERPEVVFHAAAHKHVHLLELHPHEAIRNNVLGTRNLALAARECGVARFINISTDKAVNPRNYMGLSKRITELMIRELASSSTTRFMNVRFGNVAGSTGSVLRLFRDQILKGGPLRITDPRATRYFMTIAEAVCLILQAAAQGRGGETYVFDMGEPLNIYEMARTLSLFSGLAPGKDVPVEFIGLKEGEKVTEELWDPWEKPRPTQHPRILALTGAEQRSAAILPQIDQLERLLACRDDDGLLACLHMLFPEFAIQHRKRPRRLKDRITRPTFPLGESLHERSALPS